MAEEKDDNTNEGTEAKPTITIAEKQGGADAKPTITIAEAKPTITIAEKDGGE